MFFLWGYNALTGQSPILTACNLSHYNRYRFTGRYFYNYYFRIARVIDIYDMCYDNVW